jgi:hypothetical protein
MSARPAKGAGTVKLSIQQSLLVKSAHLQLDGACRHLGVGIRENHDVAWCVTGSGFRVFDLARTLAAPFASFDYTGLKAAEPVDPRRFLAWGPAGLVLLEPAAGGESYGATWVRRTPVLALARYGAWTYLLAPDSVEILDSQLYPTGRIDVVDGWQLAITRSRLVVAAGDCLAVYDLADPQRPSPGTELQLPHLMAVAAPRIPGHTDGVLATDRLGSVEIFDVSQIREPHMLARLERDLCFTATARTRTFVVRRGADQESLDVFRVAHRLQLNRRQLEAKYPRS